MSPQVVVSIVLAALGAFLGKNPVYQFVSPLLVQLVTAYDNLEAGQSATITSSLKVKGVAYNATISLVPVTKP